jgi:hypothetical protein
MNSWDQAIPLGWRSVALPKLAHGAARMRRDFVDDNMNNLNLLGKA